MLHKKARHLPGFFCEASFALPPRGRLGATVWWYRLPGPGKIAIFVSMKSKQEMATEEEFFAGNPEAWGLYEALKKELVWRYPEMEVRVAKTQVSFFDRLMFGCVSFTRVRRKAEMPAHFITLTLGLPEPVDSPRIAVKCEPYPGRWTHHIVLASVDEIDAELLAWIDRAHQFAQR